MAVAVERLTVGSDVLREREFPVTREYTYLNCAARGPLPNRARQAVEEYAAHAQFPVSAPASAAPEPDARARTRLARLIGAQPGDLTLTPNTTYGMNVVAHGIEWRAGDNVVIPDRDYPSLMYTWHHLRELHDGGVDVRFVPFAGVGPTVDEIMAATDARTRAVALSAIRWDTGWKMDLESLGARCARAGILLAVDGVQLVGAQPVDVAACRISALSTHGYKWLMANFGAGALYVAPDAVDRIQPVFTGNASIEGVPQSFDGPLPWAAGAGRYTLSGGVNRYGYAAMDAGIALIEELGIEAVAAHDLALAARLRAGLATKSGITVVSSDDPAHASAVVVFTLGDKERDTALVEALEARNILVALRPLGVRVSPHLYNNAADVDHLLAALA